MFQHLFLLFKCCLMPCVVPLLIIFNSSIRTSWIILFQSQLSNIWLLFDAFLILLSGKKVRIRLYSTHPQIQGLSFNFTFQWQITFYRKVFEFDLSSTRIGRKDAVYFVWEYSIDYYIQVICLYSWSIDHLFLFLMDRMTFHKLITF